VSLESELALAAAGGFLAFPLVVGGLVYAFRVRLTRLGMRHVMRRGLAAR
jgi:hypothetical protein